MALEDWKSVVGSVATVVTIVQFLSGSDICRKIYNLGSTGDISGLPIVVGGFSASLWFCYGYLIVDNSMMITNGVGSILQFMYIMIYLRYCVAVGPLRTIRQQMVIFGSISMALLIYCNNVDLPQRTITDHLGMVCCASSISFTAAPLASIRKVIQTRSTEIMPFYLLFSMFLVTGLWAFYGLIIHDNYVIYTNLAGCAIVSLQLCLFVIYPSKRAKDMTKLISTA